MQRVIVLAITQTALVLVVALVGPTGADAHVAPSVDDNNRYLKVTPAADRVRLAYTVFFGENPGRQMRPGLDTDKDGLLSDDEGAAFGAKLAREVADGLEVSVDGATQRVRWATVAVGLGTPDLAAGSFSVDMIAYACLPPDRGRRHTLHVRDRFRVPRPGETEVKVEDAVGITIERARVGPFDDPTREYKMVGPGGPLLDDGLDVAFTVSDKAPRGDSSCASMSSTRSSPSRTSTPLAGILVAIGGTIAFVAIGALVARREHRARRSRRAQRARRR